MAGKAQNHILDPFTGKVVGINDDICDRLRGRYACGPTMPDGEPEFGWRTFETSPIQHEAADLIDLLLRRIAVLEGKEVAPAPADTSVEPAKA